MVAISGEFEQVCPHGINRSYICLRCDDVELSQKGITRLRAENERLKEELKISNNAITNTGIQALKDRAEKAERELLGTEKIGMALVEQLSAERTAHEETKKAMSRIECQFDSTLIHIKRKALDGRKVKGHFCDATKLCEAMCNSISEAQKILAQAKGGK